MGRRRSEISIVKNIELWSEEEIMFLDTILDHVDSLQSLVKTNLIDTEKDLSQEIINVN